MDKNNTTTLVLLVGGPLDQQTRDLVGNYFQYKTDTQSTSWRTYSQDVTDHSTFKYVGLQPAITNGSEHAKE